MPDEYIAQLQAQIEELTKISNNASRHIEEISGWYLMKDVI